MNVKTVLTSLVLFSTVGFVACGGSSSFTTGAAGSDGGAGSGTAGTGGTAGGIAGATAGAGGTAGGTAGAAAGTAGGTGGTAASTDGGSDADGGLDADAEGGSDVGAGACNALQLQGAQITKTSHAGAPPTLTGGTIALGTYLLTAMDKYNGTQGSNTHRETWVITAGHVEVVTEDSSDNKGVQHYSGSWSVATNVLTLTITCPAGAGTLNAQYTSADGKIAVLSEPQSSDQEIHTLTKQ